MIPFDFHPRTRIVFGPGKIESLGELAGELGARRALVVSDPGIVAAGMKIEGNHVVGEGNSPPRLSGENPTGLPYPSYRPAAPVVIPATFTIDVNGRIDVDVNTGDPQWDRSIREFIGRHWRAEPARRNGKPVESTKKVELSWR